MVKLRDLETEFESHGIRVIDQPDIPDKLRERAMSDDDNVTEYAVPVLWLATRPTEQAISETGLFASQVTACKLRDERTIQVVTSAFGLEDS
jgi:hypothetical protein